MNKVQVLSAVMAEINNLEKTRDFYQKNVERIEKNIGLLNINHGTQYFEYKENIKYLNYQIATAKRIYSALNKLNYE